MTSKFAIAAFAAVMTTSPMLLTRAEAQVNYGRDFCLAGQVCTNRAPVPDPGQARANRDANRTDRNALGIALGVGALALGAAAVAGAQDRGLPPPPRQRFYDERYGAFDEPPPVFVQPRRRVLVEDEPVYVESRRRAIVQQHDDIYEQPRRRVAPRTSDSVSYCMQRFRSYDPRTGTYVGFDGIQRSCP